MKQLWFTLLFTGFAFFNLSGTETAYCDSIQLNLQTEWNRQYSELQKQIENQERYDAYSNQTHRDESLIFQNDRDPADVALRRTKALLNHLNEWDSLNSTLSRFHESLSELEHQNRQIPLSQSSQRLSLYFLICQLRREIAFQNPLLNFNRILFVKRERSIAYDEHMCDQFYGCYAKAGGGLFILTNPFGGNPSIKNILQNSKVMNGRLEGAHLTPGAFLSPDLSFDGSEILFAYTQNQLTEKLPNDPYPADDDRWSPHRSFHIFKVGLDGSDLRQLTDGSCNDFDPCWLPSGRIAFISERRGGYLRCGLRPCPTYTLHSMNDDGSDITPLSFHETHEWHPSVDRDGKIVYTRWDYVDRDTNVAHHIWTTFPDGRDARAVQGNYPKARELRPWMQMDIRAIPNSGKYISTAAPHHGQAYGSIILINPNSKDDGAMSAMKRLTPDVPFPEAEGRERLHEAYATAWPLSEDFFLCVYDNNAENYGIYLVDSFGNKELLYRDPAISCLSPIPIQARPVPPAHPHQTAVGIPDNMNGAGAGNETIFVQNVYESQNEWPEETTIHSLRIIQVLPKTTPRNNDPRIGVGNQTNARAVLGAVPVEADGSAYFEAPVNKPIYFQALDERGLAVQSMRSITYVHKGEQLSCLGCHENRRQASHPQQRQAQALLRQPSKIQPDVDGSNPFSYPRLVQPVLDRHCVSCHQDHDKAPDLGRSASGFYPSYVSLAEEYGFYFNSSNGSINDPFPIGGARTSPGHFGARASKLFHLIEQGHHDVDLPDEDLYRITLWLDCNSDFYGAYENTEAQSLGQIIMPTLE